MPGHSSFLLFIKTQITNIAQLPLLIPPDTQRFILCGYCCQCLYRKRPTLICSSSIWAMYGTECAKHLKHCSTHTKYHWSHKLETRHLLKIRSPAGTGLWGVWFQRAASSNGSILTTYGPVPGCLHYTCISSVLSVWTSADYINNMKCVVNLTLQWHALEHNVLQESKPKFDSYLPLR